MNNRKATCPLCRKDTQEKFRPFCSERCKMIDLGRWFGESYTIPDQHAAPLPIELEELENND